MNEFHEAKEVICTACPRGCPLQVRVLSDGVQVEGASCRRGVAFGKTEALDPRRVLTTTVRVVEGALPVVSVRTRGPIPRRLIGAALGELRRVELQAPVGFGQVILESVAGSGVQAVTTSAVDRPGERTGS